MTFTLAHLSDLHMGPMSYFGPRHWNAKRLLGTINWHRGRKRAHLLPVLEALVADMMAQRPDHIAVTGDLVNIGLPQEHVAALDWLRALGAPDRVSVVPGNHDIYTTLHGDPGAMRWAGYMADNDAGAAFSAAAHDGEALAAAGFPYVRCIKRIALVGLNSAIPTAPFVAAGRLGPEQRHRLAGCLQRLADAGMTRVVLIHHPPLPGQAKPLKALQDAKEMADLLGDHGAELIIHGHNHRNMLAWRPFHAGDVPVVGVPSASMGRHHRDEPLARYNLYRITPGGGPDGAGRAAIEMIGRGFDVPGGPVVEVERRLLVPAPTRNSSGVQTIGA